jgi:hypothetical protein
VQHDWPVLARMVAVRVAPDCNNTGCRFEQRVPTAMFVCAALSSWRMPRNHLGPGSSTVKAAETRLFATVLDGVEHSSEQSRHPCPVLAYDPRVIALIGFLFVLLSCAGLCGRYEGKARLS